MVKTLLFLILLAFPVYSQENNEFVIPLKGYLGKEELKHAKELLNEIEKKEDRSSLFLKINSQSGDLIEVLELAKAIFELKVLKQLKVTVYLNDSVLGPAAILPFLADDLYSSLYVTWGDIPLGSKDVLPANILRNRIRSLIDSKNPHAPLLYVLADAMSDPSLQVIEKGGKWSILQNEKDNISFISASGQTLVVNQNQLKELGLTRAILTQSEFDKLLKLKKEQEAIQQTEVKAIPKQIDENLKKHIKYSPTGPNYIGHIYIGDHESMISDATWLYVKQALEYYKKNPPIFIIMELDTPGGEVFAAQKISDALMEMDTQNEIPVIALINNWAISAGAMLAYSTRFIAATKDASMGAAEPVIFGGESGKLESASEKVNSALRADFASRARYFDRNPTLAEAMVDKDLIVVWRHGHVVKLDNENQIKTSGPEPDIVISGKGKLLTLNAEEMIKYGVADLLLLPEKLQTISDDEKTKGKWPLNKTEFKQVPFFADIPNAIVDAYRMDWKTQFFVFLATPLVSSLLFMGLIVGAYIEMNHPGFGLPGIVSATCLFLIILSSFSLEIANWLELILLLTGLALLLTEIFVVPSFGIIGILGGLLFIVGLFGMLLPEFKSVDFDYDTSQFNFAGQYFLERLSWLLGSFVISMIIIALLARFVFPSFSGFKRLVLVGDEQDASRGFYAGENPQQLPQPGERGEALTPLRPAGKILVNEQIYDAISTGDFIDAGEQIEVDRLDGSTIIVNRPGDRVI